MMRCQFNLACHAAILAFAAVIGGRLTQAFVLPKRTWTTPEAGVGEMHSTVVEFISGPVVDLRGGKTMSAKKTSSSKTKGASKSKASTSRESSTGKGLKTKRKSKTEKKGGTPTLMATLKAFFASLINPRFTVKLEAKQKDQIHTVHGSASLKPAST